MGTSSDQVHILLLIGEMLFNLNIFWKCITLNCIQCSLSVHPTLNLAAWLKTFQFIT